MQATVRPRPEFFIVFFSFFFFGFMGYLSRRGVLCAIQMRVAYFAGIAAPCEDFEALVPAVLPSASSPASSALPRWSHGRVDGVEWHRSLGGSREDGPGDFRRNHPLRGNGGRPYQRLHEDLMRENLMSACYDTKTKGQCF